jgi:hypothetical protein
MADEIVDVGVKPSYPREYLGDGLYVEFDGYQFRLFAHDGISHTNEVFLEPGVVAAFLRYIERLKGASIET